MVNLKKDGRAKGSIFARTTDKNKGTKKLYYKSPYLPNKQYSTGLNDTPTNRKLISKKLEKIYLEYEHGIQDNVAINKSIFECFDEFQDYNRNVKKLHHNTIANYNYAFNKIFKSDFIVNQLNKRLYTDYFRIEKEINDFVSRSELKSSSISIYLRAIKVFMNWLSREGYISDLSIKHYFPSVKKKKPHAYTDHEINIIEEDLKELDYDMYYLFRFLVLTGSRITEALRLEWGILILIAVLLFFLRRTEDIYTINSQFIVN